MPLTEQIETPAPVCRPISFTRGDTYEGKLLQICDEGEDPGTLIPAILTGCVFAIQIKVHPLHSEALITWNNDLFFLGQSNEAIAYEANDPLTEPQTIWDEVFISVPPELTRIQPGCWYYDLEIKFPDGKLLTIYSGRATVLADNTDMEYSNE